MLGVGLGEQVTANVVAICVSVCVSVCRKRKVVRELRQHYSRRLNGSEILMMIVLFIFC